MGVGSFFSSMASDFAVGTGMKDIDSDPRMDGRISPYERRTDARKAEEAKRAKNPALYKEDDKPRAGPVRYSPPPPPIKSIEDYYNMLKQPVAPLPSLLTKKSPNYSKPTYGDVSTSSATREGGEVRSFFQSTSTGYV
jgi:hypothetical protein